MAKKTDTATGGSKPLTDVRGSGAGASKPLTDVRGSGAAASKPLTDVRGSGAGASKPAVLKVAFVGRDFFSANSAYQTMRGAEPEKWTNNYNVVSLYGFGDVERIRAGAFDVVYAPRKLPPELKAVLCATLAKSGGELIQL
jgi:hypothetical protein